MMYPSAGGQPPPQPQRKRHVGRNILIGLGSLIVLIITLAVIGAVAGGKTPVASSSPPAVSTSTSPPPAQPAAAPAPTPTPDGTYQGACDYSLGSDPVDGTAVATGDIQVTNTGNIGTIIRLVITWPQQGYSPLEKSKTIHLEAGASRDIQFNHPLTFDQITNLQSWQEGHDYADGCTYKAAITGTFGSAS